MMKQDNPEVVQAWQEAVQKEVRTRPWLAAFLLQKGSRLFARFAWFYGRLSATRRRMALGLGTAALALALSSAPTPAHAETITVGGSCTLVMAIQNANNTTTGQPNADCAAGNPAGADTIVLAGNTYSYTTTSGTGSALPHITSVITIEANGATIARDNTAGNMRIIRINSGGNLTLNNATITGGSGVSFGGGIYNNGGTLTLNNSTVSGNTATDYGGGIYNGFFSTLTLNNSTVSGNTATNGGGISNNSANGNCADTPALRVNNSTVSGNTATTRGGGIFNANGVAEITHSTITANTAPANSGAGVRSWNDNSTCTRVGGSIIAGNITGGDVAAANSPTQRFHSLGHNLIGTNGANVNFTLEFNATGDITNNVAPGLGPLADNGGPTLTHALVAGSPAIDLVPIGVLNCTAGVSTDQRGAVRADGTNRGGAVCDAGAYEYSFQTPTAVSLSSTTQTNTPNPTPHIPLLATLLTLVSGAVLWLRSR